MRNQRINTRVVSYIVPTGNKIERQDVEGNYTGEIIDEYTDPQYIRVVFIKGKGAVTKDKTGLYHEYDSTMQHNGSRVVPDDAIVIYGNDKYIVKTALESVTNVTYYLSTIK